MNTILYCLTLLVLFGVFGTVRSDMTNSFGIYLTTGGVDGRIIGYGKGDWSGIPLAESPLISGADIISYDFGNHSMTLRPETLARIPRPPVSGTPFIVVANGQRIYLGAFTTKFSSMSFAVPTIMVDRWMLVTNQAPDTLFIERRAAIGSDPRGDPRIRSALKPEKKLKATQ